MCNLLLVIAEVVSEGGWHVDLPLGPLGAEDGVPGPGLQQQHPLPRVLGEAAGQHAPGRARANNYLMRTLSK